MHEKRYSGYTDYLWVRCKIGAFAHDYEHVGDYLSRLLRDCDEAETAIRDIYEEAGGIGRINFTARFADNSSVEILTIVPIFEDKQFWRIFRGLLSREGFVATDNH